MAKAFAAEEGTGLLLTSLGAEALIPGIGEVMMGVEMALFTAVKVGKMIKHHHENKVERRQ
jgi:hypothetical protein